MTGRHALVLAGATAALLRGPPARAEPGDRHVGPWLDAGGLVPLTDAPDPYDLQYRVLTAHDQTHYWRVFFEEMALLGVGVIEYWIDRKRAVTNFDYPSLLDRLTFEAWRFDNNGFQINFIGHSLNGMSFHMLARANGMSLPGSVLVAFATSMTWEFGWEFREKISINDVMFTTATGTTLGEFVHWMGRYFESAPDPRPWHRFARWTLGLPDALHGAIDNRKRLRAGTPPDALGLSSDIWHRFELSAGLVQAQPSGDAAIVTPDRVVAPDLRVSAEFVALPGFLRAGYRGRTFGDGNVTSLRFGLAVAPDVVVVNLESDTFLAGRLTQSIDTRGGSATLIGIDLGYRFRHERFGGFTERLGQLHFPGLGIDQYVLGAGGAVWLRARVRFNADFAGVHAAAYPAYQAAHASEVDKTILRKQGYYFAWGASTRLDLEVHTRHVAAGIAFRYGRYDSQEGLDRNQEEVTDDVDAHDSTRDAEAWLRIAPMAGRLYLEARASDLEREGRVGDQVSNQNLRRISFALGMSL
ncbi:MAG: DUF3943 domain-containing protein [Deltaproteobacteria bacterium]|nr:DUF3943 domain-containing protein [Deltaproteobacteria bacterium]